MALPRMFKLPNNSVFEYKPLYYDEKKEAMQERLKKYGKSDTEKKNGGYTSVIKV